MERRKFLIFNSYKFLNNHDNHGGAKMSTETREKINNIDLKSLISKYKKQNIITVKSEKKIKAV